jgi:hypothetical protein
MKKTSFLLSLIVVLFIGGNTFAQETVPKELLLSTLNSVGHLKLPNEKVTQLMDYNTGFVDKVYDILNSDVEEKLKKGSLDGLNYAREKDLHVFLTKHETTQYLKLMEDELKPLTKQDKLLKQITKRP